MFYILALLAVTLIMIFVPLAVIFWLLGLSVKAIGAMALFALKYLLPFIIAGLIVAKVRGRDGYFDWVDYAKHAGVAAGVGLALILTFVNVPAHPKMPTEENIKTVTVSYQRGGETYTESMENEWYVQNLCNSLSNAKFKHSISEFIKENEHYPTDFSAQFVLEGGETLTYTFLSPTDICVKKGKITHYYKTTKKSSKLPFDNLYDIVNIVRERRASERWKPCVDEFFESICYTDDEKLYFEIPQEIPEGNFRITINLSGKENYDRNTTFRAQRYEVLQEIQKNQSWERGRAYQFPVGNICYDEFDIIFNPNPGEEFVYDVLPILPNKNVFRRR